MIDESVKKQNQEDNFVQFKNDLINPFASMNFEEQKQAEADKQNQNNPNSKKFESEISDDRDPFSNVLKNPFASENQQKSISQESQRKAKQQQKIEPLEQKPIQIKISRPDSIQSQVQIKGIFDSQSASPKKKNNKNLGNTFKNQKFDNAFNSEISNPFAQHQQENQLHSININLVSRNKDPNHEAIQEQQLRSRQYNYGTNIQNNLTVNYNTKAKFLQKEKSMNNSQRQYSSFSRINGSQNTMAKTQFEQYYDSHGEQITVNQIIEKNIPKYKDLLKYVYSSDYWKTHHTLRFYNITQKQIKKGPTFKAYRYHYKKKSLVSLNYNNTQTFYILAKYLKQKHQIYLYELPLYQKTKQAQFRNLKQDLTQKKPKSVIKLKSTEFIGPSLQFDRLNSRLICYSNSSQKIIIIATRTNQIICKFPVKHKRYNPILFLHTVKQTLLLLVIGGFQVVSDQAVDGCKHIQIFSIDKWSISLKQKVIKLNIGRIYPIVFTTSQGFGGEPVILILGGNTTASYRKNFMFFGWKSSSFKDIKEGNIDPSNLPLDYKLQKDINFSTNKTGVLIRCYELYEMINNDDADLVNIQNISVNIENPMKLYKGLTICQKQGKKQSFSLLLPSKRQFYSITVMERQIHISSTDIQIKRENEGYEQLEMNLYKNGGDSEMYRISQQGKLQVVEFLESNSASKNGSCCIM